MVSGWCLVVSGSVWVFSSGVWLCRWSGCVGGLVMSGGVCVCGSCASQVGMHSALSEALKHCPRAWRLMAQLWPVYLQRLEAADPRMYEVNAVLLNDPPHRHTTHQVWGPARVWGLVLLLREMTVGIILLGVHAGWIRWSVDFDQAAVTF